MFTKKDRSPGCSIVNTMVDITHLWYRDTVSMKIPGHVLISAVWYEYSKSTAVMIWHCIVYCCCAYCIRGNMVSRWRSVVTTELLRISLGLKNRHGHWLCCTIITHVLLGVKCKAKNRIERPAPCSCGVLSLQYTWYLVFLFYFYPSTSSTPMRADSWR